MTSIQAAVFREAHQPLTIEVVDIDAPSDREVLIRTVATGLCHTELHFMDGERPVSPHMTGVPDAQAHVLGHEGAGTVESVGAGVTHVRPGDHVVTCPTAFCGACEFCLSGHPARCLSRPSYRSPDTRPRLTQQGVGLGQFTGLGTYAEKMLVHENALVKIDSDIPLDRAALVGCGTLTGVGAVFNTARVRPGSTVAVIGCGGIGLSIVQGAYIAGARRIIAIDVFDSKLEMAREMGATDVINSRNEDSVSAVRSLTGGRGVDYAFEAVGPAVLLRQAVEMLSLGGMAVMVGVAPTGTVYEIPEAALLGEKMIKSCITGSNRFRIDIPFYLDLYRQGRLDLDRLVSETRPLSEINKGYAAMKAGEVARSVVVFD